MDNSTATIWIIEDNKQYRLALVDLLLEATKYTVLECFESTEAATKALRTKTLPNVILSDISLPGISGVEAIPTIKQISPETKIIMITVHDEEEKVFNAICAGADGYLLKSDGPDQILHAIQDVLEGGASINPKIAQKILRMFSGIAPVQKKYDLSEREIEILQAVVDGKTKKEIASILFLSFHTVDFHMRNIYKKLHVHSKSEAVAKALKENIV